MNNCSTAVLLAATTLATSANAQTAATTARPAAPAVIASATPSASALRPCTSVVVDPPTSLTLGKSRVVRLDFPVARLIVGGQAASRAGRAVAANAPAAPGVAPAPAPQQVSDGVADTEITLLSPTELFFLGKKTGSMNIVLQSADGRCVVKDIIVTVDPSALQSKLNELLPEERGIQVRGADTALVLTGSVTDAVKLDHVMSLATSYGDGRKVVNLLRVSAPQQVMLEVKIAEVSKTLLDRFGLDFARLVTSADGLTSSIVSGIVGGAAGLLGRFRNALPAHAVGGLGTSAVDAGSSTSSAFLGATETTRIQNPDGTISTRTTISPGTISKSGSQLAIDAQKRDGIIRILAEPNIMAISGQSASFLSGGKIFIPVPQAGASGGTTITLEEKRFGVGLTFTPTVLDGNRVNLKLASEVSDLSQSGAAFTTVGGVTSVLPSITSRSIDTTVQLGDGQSFVIAGLIKNNMNEALSKFPGLGEVPVMGALFRSTEFQTDQTELMFVVTPRLVKPLTSVATLPTDNHVVPNRGDVMLMGKGEGRPQAPQVAADAGSPATTPAAPTLPVTAPLQASVAASPLINLETTSGTEVSLSAPPDTAVTQPVRIPVIAAEPVAGPMPVSTGRP
jgi:pilus assembly protein CpaC